MDSVLLSLWGKAGDEPAPHPLLCHCLDVAAVASRLWEAAVADSFRSLIRRELAVERPDQVVVWWAALHDLGKASPAFQAQRPDLIGPLREAGLRFPDATGAVVGHGQVSGRELAGPLERFGYDRTLARQVSTTVAGHHGRFPSNSDLLGLSKTPKAVGRDEWKQIREGVFDALTSVLLAEREIPSTPRLSDSACALIAGLVTVADWIGSDKQQFPYRADISRGSSSTSCATPPWRSPSPKGRTR